MSPGHGSVSLPAPRLFATAGVLFFKVTQSLSLGFLKLHRSKIGTLISSCSRVCVFTLIVLAVHPSQAEEPSAPREVRLTDALPYGRNPIDYHSPKLDDSVARLRRTLNTAERSFKYRDGGGYLKSLLDALRIPVESQLLVFSKTALNPQFVGPKNPRAIYFNDETYVAWVPGAASLEISSIDPHKGAIFYTLRQSSEGKVRLQRKESCLTCHVSVATLQVPGLMARSFFTNNLGKPLTGYPRITHQTDFSKRWGGWYVTGMHGKISHRGNLIGESENRMHKQDPTHAGNTTDLKPFFDLSKHLSGQSDLVAHLVLNHQLHGQNLLTRVNYESRLNRHSDAEAQLLRYLLFVDETPLTSPVRGESGYAQWFQQQGPFDMAKRSLRQLNLNTRLLEHRLSYLIYSRSFDALPQTAKSRLYRRLWEILTGRDESETYRIIPQQERKKILEILRDTKKDLPGYWFATS